MHGDGIRRLKAMRGLTVFVLAWALSMPAHAFDQSHAAWAALLHRYVRVTDHGNASRVDYAGMLSDKGQLDAYTRSLSAVTPNRYRSWPQADREAFLINAYNAFTIELVLTRYPHLGSIKDLGWLFFSPWKKDFFKLLGDSSNLDHVESLLRHPGDFDDPRIHFAINCASVGCPMLRNEAYVGARLDAQLDDQMRRFLSDRSRNLYDAADKVLKVSKIFDWYGDDFARGWKGITSVRQFFADHAALLTDDAQALAAIRAQRVPIDYLSYDWSLNDVSH